MVKRTKAESRKIEKNRKLTCAQMIVHIKKAIKQGDRMRAACLWHQWCKLDDQAGSRSSKIRISKMYKAGIRCTPLGLTYVGKQV